MLKLFAVTNRGIEAICALEMARIRGTQITDVAYRRVHATYTGNVKRLLALRTVDDLFIHLATWQEVSHHRAMLDWFEQFARDLDLWQAFDLRSEIQPLGDHITFSVSANFVGRRNYNAEEIKIAMAAGITAISGWQYEEDDRQSDINLRLFIEHETAIVGMRLANSPLGKRAYKEEHLPGSLKPPVAAALLLLTEVAPGQTLLDPCCGTGTILIEAAAIGVNAVGGDNDTQAITAAHNNAAAADLSLDLQTWDVTALPLEDGAVDAIATNLPWGRQVEVNATLERFYHEACAEMERVLKPDGRVVLLTNLPHLVTFPTFTIHQQIGISLFGQQPTIVVASRGVAEINA